jgi:hypothetical protein
MNEPNLLEEAEITHKIKKSETPDRVAYIITFDYLRRIIPQISVVCVIPFFILFTLLTVPDILILVSSNKNPFI